MSTDLYNEGWATKWDDMKKYGPFSRHIRRLLKEMIRPLEVASILDVGCGQGALLEELILELGDVKCFGVDVSSTAVTLASQRIPHGQFWTLDISQAFLNLKFDLVICSEVLEHIEDDVTALRNLREMTGKYLLISTPQGRMRRFERHVGHVRNYAPRELARKLEGNGFSVVSVIEWGFPFYSPLYRDLLELTDSQGTTGQFGTVRKTISILIYYLFMLNSYKRGDELFILATPTVHQD